MLKTILLTLVAFMVSFALFAFMASLIEQDIVAQEPPKPFNVISFVEQAKDSKVTERQKLKKLEPPKLVDLKPTTLNPVDVSDVDLNIHVPGPSITGNELTPISLNGASNAEARPIVRVSPKYPMIAQQNGTQGWVQLGFSISENGSVTDIEVIDAEPLRVFNKEAIRALKKWKYKAKLIDGKPIKQYGLSVMLEFNMDQTET